MTTVRSPAGSVWVTDPLSSAPEGRGAVVVTAAGWVAGVGTALLCAAEVVGAAAEPPTPGLMETSGSEHAAALPVTVAASTSARTPLVILRFTKKLPPRRSAPVPNMGRRGEGHRRPFPLGRFRR